MFNKEAYIKRWKNHIATFSEMGNIKILDFKAPDSNEYRMRFLFEEDHYILHISGDYGNLTATNCHNMTFRGFKDFVNNIGYFIEKINCADRNIYYYDEKAAREELIKELDEHGCGYYNGFLDRAMEDFDERTGVSEKGYEAISEFISDAWEVVPYLGKFRSDILDIYMLAFKLAVNQLAETTKDEMFVEIANIIGKGDN